MLFAAIAARVSEWQEQKLAGGLEGAEPEEEADIYSAARIAEVSNIRCSIWLLSMWRSSANPLLPKYMIHMWWGSFPSSA